MKRTTKTHRSQVLYSQSGSSKCPFLSSKVENERLGPERRDKSINQRERERVRMRERESKRE